MYSMQLEIVYLYPKGTINNGQSRETVNIWVHKSLDEEKQQK